MTTPEKFRSRQRVELILLLIVSTLMVLQYWLDDRQEDKRTEYFRAQNAKQDLCFAEQFRRVDDVLTKRSQVATKIYANQQAYSTGEKSEAMYESDAAELTEERRLLKFPDYPPPGCPPLATQEKRDDR